MKTAPIIGGLLANEPLIKAARDWLKDCVWRDIDEDGIDEASNAEVLAAVERHYDGGLAQFMCDQEPAVDGPRFTPGPWRAIGREIWVGKTLLCRSEPESSPHDNHDAIENARLIASAPDLFAIVKDYADNADCGDGGQGEACSSGKCWHCQAVAMVKQILTP